MEQPSPFAARLREQRERANLTQDALGDRVGVRQGTVSSWETDATEPRVSEIRSLAKILACTTDYLLGLSDAPQPMPAGHFLVDLATYEAHQARRKVRKGERWYAVIPDRFRIVPPREYAALADQLPPSLR